MVFVKKNLTNYKTGVTMLVGTLRERPRLGSFFVA